MPLLENKFKISLLLLYQGIFRSSCTEGEFHTRKTQRKSRDWIVVQIKLGNENESLFETECQFNLKNILLFLLNLILVSMMMTTRLKMARLEAV